jgi:hypothetical protein
MKQLTFILIAGLLMCSCGSLDLHPLSDGSSETWNATPEEIEMSLNGLYKADFWLKDSDEWTDDFIYRDGTTEVTGATINGETAFVKEWWTKTYKAIARANNILQSISRATKVLSPDQINNYTAEARFVRACQYSRLLSHYGNIIYTDSTLDIEQALNMKQMGKEEVLQKIYADFDFAASILKTTISASDLKRATKGAALAMKARIALYMGDWATAKTAAKACMDLDL